MKVFISWSGETSRELGEALRNWFPTVLQAVKPYFTPSDIEKGARWYPEISKELQESQIGIICLTRDNLQSPWIIFESGAIAKSFDAAHVCPILFGISKADLVGPLLQFQATTFGRNEMRALVKTVNGLCGEYELEDGLFGQVFEMWWPKLEANVAAIIGRTQTHASSAKRSDRELLEEILELSKGVIQLTNARSSGEDSQRTLDMLRVEQHNQMIEQRMQYERILDLFNSKFATLTGAVPRLAKLPGQQ